jgi:6,7-dimethyl-8-ribityllumazine synthase
MAAHGNTSLTKGIPEVKDAFVVIIKTEWNAHIVDKLAEGAIKILQQQSITYRVVIVPGAVEIPFTVQQCIKKMTSTPDAVITLGTVVRGDTPHFEYVCKFVTEGVLELNLTSGTPVIFGVLTVNNEEQALQRVGGRHGHKGEEAAITAIKMIALNRSLDE